MNYNNVINNVKPHPCGYLGDTKNTCRCMPGQIIRYQKRISGPILDRIDIHLEVPAVKLEKLTSQSVELNNETSKDVRRRVQKARDAQTKRFKKVKLNANSEMTTSLIREFCELSSECMNILRLAVSTMQLSARSYHRVIKLARTIADLEASENIAPTHIAEALQYRPRSDL